MGLLQQFHIDHLYFSQFLMTLKFNLVKNQSDLVSTGIGKMFHREDFVSSHRIL